MHCSRQKAVMQSRVPHNLPEEGQSLIELKNNRLFTDHGHASKNCSDFSLDHADVSNPLSCANVASQGPPALIIVIFIRNSSTAFQCCYPLHLQNVSGDCMWQDFCAKSSSSAAGSSIMVTSCLNRRVSASVGGILNEILSESVFKINRRQKQ